MSFDSLQLSTPILKALASKGYDNPTPIQKKAIPIILSGADVMAAAQTGTGKTAGFTLPMLSRLSEGKMATHNHVRALILTPTRELAIQVADSVSEYGQFLPLNSEVVYGGVKINPQMMALRKGADVLVATPGRLLDLYSQNALKFNKLEFLVLDEADRMLDMGFVRDIKKIIELLPKKRQNLLFSATFSNEIKKLARGILKDPKEVSVSPQNSAAKLVVQLIHPVDKKKKAALLAELIKVNTWSQVLVFCRTKHGANRLVKQLEQCKIKSLAIHGNKSQGARIKALSAFKSGDITVLVATDIAARGLDIDQLPQVVNFDLPDIAEDYVHRIGRTGRAGAKGHAISLVCADEVKQLTAIESLIKQLLTRVLVDGFEPVHDVPVTALNLKDKKPKKPKKPKSRQIDDQKSSNPKQRASSKPNKNAKKRNTSSNKAKKHKFSPK